ncbi:major facilitator superfamily domain-containing protein [Phascolomyces articulosus]|uniref:Major facilitator superfamily domain-containing protein n=1 Tax=Phascolomyces articulosus TaxID=60185 RepID=A0AAD5K5G0_9FUNG|nr:major facilitator superfamily domain-containing protein [Phascolomyces articulosus]
MIIWGITLAATAAVKTGTQLIITRLILGIATGGVSPGMLYYGSLWFKRQNFSSRMAICFTGSTNVAGAIGGLLAYGIVQMDGLQGLHGWQWIFIIEALPAIAMGILFLFILPDGPENAKFLNEKERQFIASRIAFDNEIMNVDTTKEGKEFSWAQLFKVFQDWKTYAFIPLSFCSLTTIRCIRMFLPIIVRGLGTFDAVTTQGMSAPPYVVGILFTLVFSNSSDYFKERGLHLAFSATISLIGFVLLIALRYSSAVGLYIIVCIAVGALTAVTNLRTTWISNNFSGKTKRAVAIATIHAVSSIGSPFGGQFYRADDAPKYHPDYRYIS